MKSILSFLLLIILTQNLQSQTKADSIISKYDAAKTNDDFQNVLDEIYLLFSEENSEQTRKTALQTLVHIKKNGDMRLASYLEIMIGRFMINSGDYGSALQMSMPSLELAIKDKDTASLYSIYRQIGDAYLYSRNYEKALINYQRMVALGKAQGDKSRLSEAYVMIGDLYSKTKMSDSGLVYTQLAMTAATEANEEWLYKYILATTAENYISAEDYDLAMPFLRKSLEGVIESKTPDDITISVVYNDFAQAFLGMKVYDSTYFYAQNAVKEAKPNSWNEQLLRSYEYLYQSFEQTSQPDSTYKYFRLAINLKDSLFDMEKVKSIESITFQQQLKEQEKELEAQKLEEERQQNLQYALLGIGIITAVILFLLLSRSFITNTRVIKFFSVLVLLIVFEFLNLLLHPFLEKITHHSPILMLLCLVCIAALLVPMHHKIEHWATHKLVEKNKQIRLAAAKKTIEQLEPKPDN